MSRKWERMVVKNKKSINAVRKKQGIATIEDTVRVRNAETVIKGRSWMFPSFLVLFAVLYFVTSFSGPIVKDGLYWFTGLSYILLGFLVYLVRRPVIRISASYLSVRRFAGDKLIQPKDIAELTLNQGHVIIQLTNKKKYMYTRFQHRFPMDELNAKLREFADRNKVALKDEAV